MTWRANITRFWGNPEYNQFKAIVLIAILAGGAFFVSKFVGNPASSQAGSILEATRDTETLGSGVTLETVTELNKEVERLNKVRTSDAWYVFEGRKKRAEESLTETLNVRSEVISSLATDGKTVDRTDIALAEDLVELLPESTQRVIETPVAITGELYTEHVDDFENPENSYFRSFVVTDDGESYDILPTEEIGFVRATVSISGNISGSTIIGDPEPIEIKSTIRKHTHGDDKIIPSDTKMTSKIALFLVNYSDDSDDVSPFTPEEAEVIFFNGPTNEFYKEQSYNRSRFGGDVFGWYTLPRASDPCSVDLMDGELDPFLEEDNVDLTGYDHIVIYSDCSADSGYIPSSSTLGPVNYEFLGEEYDISSAVLRYYDDTTALNESSAAGEYLSWTNLDGVFSHELGHSLGVMHANGLDCGLVSYESYGGVDCIHEEYGNSYDKMGKGWYGLHFNGLYKDLLGWMNPLDVEVITESGTYTIGLLESSLASKKYAQIKSSNPLEESVIYTIEYRKGIGFDGNLNDLEVASNENGLFVYRVFHDRYDFRENYFTYLLDMQPTSNSWNSDTEKVTLNNIKDFANKNGNPSTFKDVANNITIGPIIFSTPTNITFEVTMPDTDCHREQPLLKLDPYGDYLVEEEEDGDLNWDVYIQVINRDTAFCGDVPEFSYSVNADSLGLEFDGDVVDNAETVRVDSFALAKIDINDADGDDDVLPGVYPITVTATNLTSGMTSDPFTFNITVE